MGRRENREISLQLLRVARRFAAWRANRRFGTRIPGSLWGAAVRVAASCGVCQTSKELGLDYYTLQKRLQQSESKCVTARDPDRTGTWTSGIVATTEGRRIALFFTGRQHAGENLSDLLKNRAGTLGPPIQMCDALSRNVTGELRTIVANCMAHGRRKFVEIYDRFEDECGYILKALKIIYKNDKLARENNLSREQRLQFHQAESGPAMSELHDWMTRQFDEKLVEPNSALGEAISYMLKHWKKLTLFLRLAGAPLDNNICERALKKAIQHRKNSLFCCSTRRKTVRG